MNVRLITTVVSITALLGVFSSPVVMSASQEEMVAAGKAVAFHRKKGNCLTCHNIPGGNAMGNLGPPLIAMKSRFPDKTALRSQIWNSNINNPASAMPPFGKHNILTEKEIDQVVEYMYTL